MSHVETPSNPTVWRATPGDDRRRRAPGPRSSTGLCDAAHRRQPRRAADPSPAPASQAPDGARNAQRFEWLAAMALALGIAGFVVTLVVGAGGHDAASLWTSSELSARLLRLMRVAAMALPLLALLAARTQSTTWLSEGAKGAARRSPCAAARQVSRSAKRQGQRKLQDKIQRGERWISARAPTIARAGFCVGVPSMPLVLALAAVVDPAWKFALPLPAVSTTIAVVAMTILARRERLGPPVLAWGVVESSLAFGLGVGCFAFAGPFPAPPGFTAYSDAIRTIAREAHAWIVWGAMVVLAVDGMRPSRRAGRRSSTSDGSI